MSGLGRSGSCCISGETSSQRPPVLRLMCIQTLVIVVRGDRTKCCLFVLYCPVCVCFAEEAEHQRNIRTRRRENEEAAKDCSAL